MSEWIKCSDRMPDFEHGYVLVACEGGNVDKTFYSVHRESHRRHGSSYSRKYLGKDSGFFELSHKYGYKITHWQPLPEPPK